MLHSQIFFESRSGNTEIRHQKQQNEQYIRKHLRFEILRTTVISLCGERGARKNIVDINSLDLNLESQGQG